MSLESSLHTLASYRAKNSRASQDIFEKGVVVLKSRSRLGDEGWVFLEQLALAAIDIGRLDVADECLKQLVDKFPGSPRVDVLTGIRMEATESPSTVLQFYDEILNADSANGAIWKRRISILKRLGKLDKAVEALVSYLDTFYTDLEGWLELADMYSSCNLYTQALQSLSHALLLSPQNPFTFLQFAETAYTAGDLPLALKMFLVVIDMTEHDIALPQDETPCGISVRAWWGIKLCSRHLLTSNASTSSSNTPLPKRLNVIDELATERVLNAYSGESGADNRPLVSKWMIAR